MRRSFKVAPGVRLNVSKSGLGVSGGVKGARVAVHSTGRQTTMLGNPIVGFGYMKSKQMSGTQKGRSKTGPSSALTPVARSAPFKKPGLLGSRADKALYRAVITNDPAAIERVANELPQDRGSAVVLAGLQSGKPQEKIRLLSELFEKGDDPAAYPFIRRYASNARFPVAIGPGLHVALPIGRDLVAFVLASAYQTSNDLESSIRTIEGLPRGPHVILALVDAYWDAKRYQDVVDLTDRLTNEDDLTALLCGYRAIAFREMGLKDAALASFKEALKTKKRESPVRHFILTERARTYYAMNRKAQARKDLERILAEDSSDEGVRKMLAEFKA